MAPDPKRRKPIRSALGIAAMHDKVAAEGRCRICGRRNRVWFTPGGARRNTLNAHHIVPRGDGDDVPENAMPLCGSGTTGCHGDVELNHGAARRLAGAAMLPEEIAYVIERMGEWWLERRYNVRPLP